MKTTNKYYQLLKRIVKYGLKQENKKGNITFLINEKLDVTLAQAEQIFDEHPIAKKKLAAELELYMSGETNVEEYNKVGVMWWDYCSPTLINSYPTYFAKLPALLEQINNEKRNSKNYVLFIGETGVETNQLPCLSLIQFQIVNGEVYTTVYQRSADSNLGLPSDLYQVYLISKMIDLPLARITFFIGNAHIYENNLENTIALLNGDKVKFALNV